MGGWMDDVCEKVGGSITAPNGLEQAWLWLVKKATYSVSSMFFSYTSTFFTNPENSDMEPEDRDYHEMISLLAMAQMLGSFW
jgi:hypothetical protein